MTRRRSLLMAAAWLAAAAVPAVAQTPAMAVLDRAGARARGAERGVDGYILELGVLGVTGTEFVQPRVQSPDGVQYAAPAKMGGSFGAMGTLDALALALHQPRWIAERRSMISYGGIVDESGAPAYVIEAAYPLFRGEGSKARGFTAHFDTATLQLRRVELEIETRSGAVLWMRADYSDFRPVEGIEVPFGRRLVVRGISAVADTAETRTELNELRASLPRLDDPGRKKALRRQDMLERVLSHDEMVVDVTVTSVRVNERPPAGLDLRPRNAP